MSRLKLPEFIHGVIDDTRQPGIHIAGSAQPPGDAQAEPEVESLMAWFLTGR